MDYLFQNKKKNIIALCFTVFYFVMLVINGPFWGISRLAIPIAFVVLLFTHKKEYLIKKWILPVAFGIALIGSIRTLISQIDNIEYVIEFYGKASIYSVLVVCSVLTVVAGAFMFVGVLLDFKRPLKYGSLAVAVIGVATLVLDFISVGGFKYIQSVPADTTAVNIYALILSIAQTLFYIGIFILATNKEE